jgi:hypothetical protein
MHGKAGRHSASRKQTITQTGSQVGWKAGRGMHGKASM